MNAVYPFQKSPRCSATSKLTKKPCQAPAVNGWTVCRFHGARGGAPKGERNGAYRPERVNDFGTPCVMRLAFEAHVF
jgi:hypothetical protein